MLSELDHLASFVALAMLVRATVAGGQQGEAGKATLPVQSPDGEVQHGGEAHPNQIGHDKNTGQC
jgi:hypothetical protein